MENLSMPDVLRQKIEPEKIKPALDFVNLCLDPAPGKKCKCSKECIDALLKLVALLSIAWDAFEADKEQNDEPED